MQPNSEINTQDLSEKLDSSEDLLKQDSNSELKNTVTNDSDHATEYSLMNGDVSVKSTQRVTKAQKRRVSL